MTFDATLHPHRRFNPLTSEWVLVSPHRAQRPWLGQVDPPVADDLPVYDSGCYLCPGNTRVGGIQNPDYPSVFVFDNDFAALQPDTPSPGTGDPLLISEGVSGESRVICFSPDHARTLPQLDVEEIGAVIDCWCDQSADLGSRYPWVQVFENKGAMMGCSNPHPHGQLWATSVLPTIAATEDRTQRDWLDENGAPMLLQLAAREATLGERVVVATDLWLAIVPWWASWPFETLLLPRFPVRRLPELLATERTDLACVLKELTSRYDNLFETSFPYSMGWHGAPFMSDDSDHWQLHAHFYPPLLRSSSVRKFMVGYEMLAEAQRDLTPEQAAARLRDVSPSRFKA